MTGPGTVHPLVHVVVVDYDGGELTLECLRSVLATDWPADRLRVVLVDNASAHPVTARVAAELPAVEIVRNARNLGFAGGANTGLRRRGDADYVAIVNNDATVEPDWLAPLVATLTTDAGPAGPIGAACPKILLAGRFTELVLSSPTRRRGPLDRRAVGVRVSGASVDGADVWARTQLVDGFWGPEPMAVDEPGAQWTTGRAVVRVPAPDGDDSAAVALRLAADTDVTVTVHAGTATTSVPVGRTPTWLAVGRGDEPVTVINNVGTAIAPDGYAADRGWLDVDRGQHDRPTDVDAWCGAAVLLTRGYLDAVGLFDERLFLYYEDVELSERGRRRGWRSRTAPASVVHHVHAATSTDGSALKDHYNERNRLLVLTRTAGFGRASREVVRYLLVTLSYARRDVVARWARGERGRPDIVRRRLRALAAYASTLPAFGSGRGSRR